MSREIFAVGDLHLGHANIINFTTFSGGAEHPMRPFSSVDEMHHCIVTNWNSVVRPQDKVYVLGDVAMKKEALPVLRELNGHLRLVRGNHDIFPTKLYLEYFDDIYGVRVIDNFILSHIPIHPESVKPRWVNVHGHLHNNAQQGHLGNKYFNASIEMLDYTPVTLGQISEWLSAFQWKLEEPTSRPTDQGIRSGYGNSWME